MRRNFPKAVIAAAFARAAGRCEGLLDDGNRCSAVLVKGRWRCDHVIPDALGGEPVLSNSQCLCPSCDSVKTPDDQSNIARAKRREAADIGGSLKAKGRFPQPPKRVRAAKDKLPLPPRRSFFVDIR